MIKRNKQSRISKKLHNRNTNRVNSIRGTTNSPYTTIHSNLIIIPPIPEKAYTICVSDWNKIKEKIKSIKEPNRICAFLSSGCLGAFVSSLISIINMYNEKEVSETWYKITIWCLLIISLIMSIILFCIDKEAKEKKNNGSNEVLDEMKSIEKKFSLSLIDKENEIPI